MDVEERRLQESKERETKSLRSAIFVIIVSTFLGILVVLEYCEPIDKTFSPQSFYLGKYSKEVENPRDVYSKMVSSKVSSINASNCVLTPTYISLDDSSIWHPLGSNPDIAWPVKGVNSGSFDNVDAGMGYNINESGEQIESNAEQNGYIHWYVWANASNMEIVSPWAQVKLLNSNVDNDSSVISMTAVGNSGTNGETRWLEVRNIRNWFCHSSSSEHITSHRTRIGLNPDPGASDIFGDMGQGFAILGVATKDTYIVGMRRTSSGQSEECSPYYVFHPEEEVSR